jgi:hypothetical protein
MSYETNYATRKIQDFQNEALLFENRTEAETVRLLDEKTQEQMGANFRLAPKATNEEIMSAVKCHEEQRSLLGHLKDNAYFPYYCKSDCARCTKAKNTLNPNVLALIDTEVWKRDAAWMLSIRHKSMRDHPSLQK